MKLYIFQGREENRLSFKLVKKGFSVGKQDSLSSDTMFSITIKKDKGYITVNYSNDLYKIFKVLRVSQM